MFTNCANNPIYIPNGGECDDCSQLESRVDNLEEAMTEVQEELPDKQDKLTAGGGIFITPDGIISTTSSMTRVTITGTDPYYSSDMTFSEISSAYNNGNAIVANYNGQMLTLQNIDGSEAVFASTDDNGSITFFTITNGNTISSSVMTVGEMVGATATTDGERGTVPAPSAGDEEKFLKGDGTWAEVSGLTHLMDGKANGSLRSNTAFPDGVIERGGQSIDGTLGNFATALGAETMATGMGAFAHGMMTMASGTCAHAEGARTAATGGGSHAEGEQTAASGARSHAEGLRNTASGSESHVGGALSETSGDGAFAHGQGLKASSPLQTVFGKYNVEDSNSEYAFIIGNGTSSNRSNLFAVKWDGTVEINGQALLPANGNSF